ncbi:hypothetical protein [Pleurocapsa sp. FMAR1]|nr:hypothetical protein [Pleurocapsa sp. FMAR1]
MPVSLYQPDEIYYTADKALEIARKEIKASIDLSNSSDSFR